MSARPELVLAGVLLLLYLTDCACLRAPADAMVRQDLRGRIRGLVDPGRVTLVNGKVLYWLPPLTPWQPLYRLDLVGAASDIPPACHAETLATLAAALLMLGCTAVIGLAGQQGVYILLALAGIYLTAILLSAWLGVRVNGLGWWRVFAAIACPPHALNLLRRRSLAQAPVALAALASLRDARLRARQLETLLPVLDPDVQACVAAAIRPLRQAPP